MKDANKFFKDIITRIAEQSECRSRKVGSIIVADGRIVSEGWNDAPRKCSVSDCDRCNSKDKITSGSNMELALCLHSEINAISSAAYLGFSIKGSVMYTTTKPCGECAKAISACHIKEVYYMNDYNSKYTDLIFEKSNIKHGLF